MSMLYTIPLLLMVIQSSSLSDWSTKWLVTASMTPKAQLVSTQCMLFISLMVIFCRHINYFYYPLLSGWSYKYLCILPIIFIIDTDSPSLYMYLSILKHLSYITQTVTNRQYYRIYTVSLKSLTWYFPYLSILTYYSKQNKLYTNDSDCYSCVQNGEYVRTRAIYIGFYISQATNCIISI